MTHPTAKYLVDANVLSEGTKPRPHPGVVDWLRQHERELVVDPVILGELRFGILLLDPGRRRRGLERWFHRVAATIDCLEWDSETGQRWAQLLADLRSIGRVMPIKDSLIAASALQRGLTLVTRNRRDFEPAGLEMVDPFEWGGSVHEP